MITVALRPEPRIVEGEIAAREFELVKRWLALNSDTLIDYWNGTIEYTEDVLQAIKPIAASVQTAR
jgi:hypothetical protein